jgi:uncharacterized protein YvpB
MIHIFLTKLNSYFTYIFTNNDSYINKNIDIQLNKLESGFLYKEENDIFI